MEKRKRLSGKSPYALFGSVRNKLLVLMIALSLLPLMGMSIFSYWMGKNQIQERIRLSLGKMAQDTADKVDLMLRGKKEEIRSMATTYPIYYSGAKNQSRPNPVPLLNNYCLNHDAYDLLMILDGSGNLAAINTVDRDENPLPAQKLSGLLGKNISMFPEEQKLFVSSIAGHSFHHDWYQSPIVQQLYNYEMQDESHRYNIALSEPIRDPVNHNIVGVWINILNWSHFQDILDSVEMDLANLDLRTGYAFMFDKDADTFIAHKYRVNRTVEGDRGPVETRKFYGTRLEEDYGLSNLSNAVVQGMRDYSYTFPGGGRKICGLAQIDDLSFGWTVGVEIDESDIYRPMKKLSYWLFGVAILLAALVVGFTYLIAKGITVPLKTLIRSASTIAQGNFKERVPIRSSDELGILASTFNEMAGALSLRETQLQELNRNLENMVHDRTLELENSHEALKRAYLDLQSAQEQLVQTEKMASLGQLVAGIAHEIKNPLNFIYGNTGFLADYTQKLQLLVESFDALQSISREDRDEIARLKEGMHYSFVKDDLKILIDNFSEGARRINTIVSDLRTFSRMDADKISDVDIHASLELSLSLMRNQYKKRIEIHKEYGDIPKIQGFAGKLNQVFLNLLSNAFQAIPGNGDVWIRTRTKDSYVEVEVEDNGVGIPRENFRRIFEPFFTTKPVGQGTGLGLSISYGIIEQHRGRIDVTSVPLKGTSFVVRLPISQEKAE
ncbi:MAG TPA: ATP-binding protein [Acidobacteriota bacterium]|nr:ATP-binding protein [Acidobacteriota bacterium]